MLHGAPASLSHYAAPCQSGLSTIFVGDGDLSSVSPNLTLLDIWAPAVVVTEGPRILFGGGGALGVYEYCSPRVFLAVGSGGALGVYEYCSPHVFLADSENLSFFGVGWSCFAPKKLKFIKEVEMKVKSKVKVKVDKNQN